MQIIAEGGFESEGQIGGRWKRGTEQKDRKMIGRDDPQKQIGPFLFTFFPSFRAFNSSGERIGSGQST